MDSTFTELHLQILEKSAISCADVEAVLGDLVDGDLPISLNDRIRDHIDGCPCCQRSEESYRWIVESARELRDEEPAIPRAVQNRLRRALNERLGLSLSAVEG